MWFHHDACLHINFPMFSKMIDLPGSTENYFKAFEMPLHFAYGISSRKAIFFPQNLLVCVKGGPSPCFLQLDPMPLFLLMPPRWKATGEGRWQDHYCRCWKGELITTLNCYFVKHHFKYFKTCLTPDALWREQQHGRRPSKCHTLSRLSQVNGKGSSALTMS